MKWGTMLTPAQLFVLMGFPFHLYEQAGVPYSPDTLRRFVGNTIHPAVFGACASTLLACTGDPSLAPLAGDDVDAYAADCDWMTDD